MITVVEDESSAGDVHIFPRSRYTSSEEVSDDDPGVDDNPTGPYPRHANPKPPRGFQIQKAARSVVVYEDWVSSLQKSKHHFLSMSAVKAFKEKKYDSWTY